MADTAYEAINETKAKMDHIYNQSDPRDYFRELKDLHYKIPSVAKPTFRKLIKHLKECREDRVNVLDIGCSYGVNSALLKHDLTMDALYDHWGQEALSDALPAEVVDCDRRFFAERSAPGNIDVIGLDQAENAIAYGKSVGLLDDGLAVNLEEDDLSIQEKERLAPVDLVMSTGCVGYVTEKSFERLMPAVSRGQRPWVANFVLRMFPFEAIEEALDAQGYVTEKLEGQTFLQRNFASADEQDNALEQLSLQGIDPTNKEADGQLFAEFFLSRPEKEAQELPIERLLSN